MRPNASTVAESGLLAAAITSIVCSKGATKHQIKVNKDGGTVGTLTLTAKAAGAATAETLYDQNGAAIVFNLASSTPQTYVFEAVLDSIIITPAGLDGTYKYEFAEW